MTILSYRNFFIVTRSNGAVDLINPHNERVRVVKSVRAAKWLITSTTKSCAVKQSTSLQSWGRLSPTMVEQFTQRSCHNE